MNSKKKKVLVASLVVCLIAIASLGTVAWFTATDSVTNEFYVGDSTTDPDDVFGVDVWETVGDEMIGVGTADDEGATYEDILPGQILDKEPVLENTGIHPQYVRAIVTVSGADILKEAMEGDWGDADKFLAGTDPKWTLEDILYTDEDTLVYVYYYDEVLPADDPETTEVNEGLTTPVFDAVVIPTGLTVDQAAALDNFQISVLGQVIQSEHLDPAITTAQEAFAKYWDAEGTIAGYTEEEIISKGTENIDAGAVDTYYTLVEAEEIALTDVTVSVTDAVVTIPDDVMNATIIIDGGNFTLAEGAKIVKAEGAGGLVVYVTEPFTVNGEVVGTDITKAEAEAYFENVLVLWYF